jgi:hypothetical protein
VEGVRYDELAPLLLNEVQQQQRTLQEQAHLLAMMQRELDELRRR